MTDVTDPVPSDPAETAAPAVAPAPASTPGEALRASDEDVRGAMFDATHGQAVESAEALQAADEAAGVDRATNVFDGSSPSTDPADVAADPDGSTPVDVPGSEPGSGTSSESAPPAGEDAAPAAPAGEVFSSEAEEPVAEAGS